jgi:hypothetical protein
MSRRCFRPGTVPAETGGRAAAPRRPDRRNPQCPPRPGAELASLVVAARLALDGSVPDDAGDGDDHDDDTAAKVAALRLRIKMMR